MSILDLNVFFFYATILYQIKFVHVNLFRIGLIKKRRPPGLKQIIFYSTFCLPTSHPNIVKFVIEMKNVQLE